MSKKVNPENLDAGQRLITAIFGLVLIPVQLLTSGWALWALWGWFVAPGSGIVIPFWVAVGLCLLCGWVFTTSRDFEAQKNRSLFESVSLNLSKVFYNIIVVGLGFIVQFFV